MKLFKLFYQLIYANRVAVLIGFIFLIAVSIPINAQYRNSLENDFTVKQSKVAIFNHDVGHPLSDYLVEYLEENASVIPLEQNPEVIADAFFEEKIYYALTIPEGFGDSLLQPIDQYQPLGKTVIGSQIDETYVDVMLGSYISNVRILSSLVTDPTSNEQIKKLVTQLEDTLEPSVAIVPIQTSQDTELLAFGSSYTHFASYVLTMVLITIFGYVVTSMRNIEVVKRDRMSMMSEGRRVVETFIGCLSFSFLSWLLFMVTAAFIYGPNTLFSFNGRLILLSSFIATFGVQAMAYFIVTIAPNRGAITFLATLTSIFIAFSSGIFVPREFVSQPMQQIASLATPIWQVRADEIILNSNTLTSENWQLLLSFFGIQILIGLAYYGLSFVIHKYRQQNSIYLT